ncbi:MAG: GAF domain-containing protein, partial [Oligoflexia bacterium]|nr:GAF domain-containing protein [Oligoflexia bacterium]
HHLGTPDRPAVLFIDNLQWADETSLELLQHLLEDHDPGRLLLLLAARPDSSTCSRLFKRLSDRGETIASIALGPLNQAAVRDLLAETLHADGPKLDALAGAVHAATGGNPFFIERYLRSAVATGAVRPDPAHARWDWDPQQMAHLAPTDNVLDLLALQVAKLPATTSQVLGTAACVGGRFALDLVAQVEDMSHAELLEHLDPAIDAGMVQPADAWQDPDITHNGRFIHERIREAFERSLGSLAPSRFVAVATLLRARGAAPADLAGKLWLGRSALTPDQLIDAAQAQLQAGNKALDGGAARVACIRFDRGITLLGDSDAPPRRELEEGFVIAAMPAGRADETPVHLDRLRALAQDIDQRSHVECLALKAAALCGDFSGAISIGLAEAARLGIAVPDDLAEWMSAIMEEGARLQGRQAARQPQDLVDLPLISDPAARREVALLSQLGLVAFSRPEVFAWVHTRMAATSVEAGNNPETAQGWATYSLLCCARGNYAAGRAYGSMARALADRFGIPPIIASVTHLTSSFAEAWYRPLLEVREEIIRARQIAIDAGLAEIAVFTTWNLSWFDLLGGARIDLALSHVDEDLELARNSLRHAQTETVAIAGRRRLLELRGDTVALGALDDAGHTRNDLAQRLSGHVTLMTADCVLEMWVATHRADWALVHKLAKKVAPHLRTIAASQFTPVAVFAQTMAAIGSRRPDALKTVDRAIDQFDTWAAINSQRTWQVLLLRAERTLLQGQASLDLFDQAIDAAVALGRADGEALCCARAATAWVDNRRLATSYATQAHAAYGRWGAPALARAIEERFPLLPRHISQTAGATSTPTTSVDFNIDVHALIAATQAVSSCLDFDGLTQEVMRVTLGAGGADRGGLFMLRQGQPECVCVQIDGKFQMWDADTPSPFPRSLVRLVARTGKALLVGNARLDPRLQGTQWPGDVPQSVLCLPISSQARILAVLVLENSLIAGAFTERHLSVLEIVAGQVAISLQNATLFQEQRRMVDAVSRFVPREFLHLVGRPSIQEVVAGDAVEFDMGCLFSDIRNFTARSEQMTAGEVFEFLNRYLSHVAPVIRSNGGFIDKYIGDAVMALFPVDPSAAVSGGLGLLAGLRRFNARWGVPPVTVGIGIHWGHMLLGTLGSEQRLQGTVVSDAVNTASRLEALTKSNGVDLLVSGELWDLVADRGFSARALGTTVLRGRSTPTRLYEVLGDDPESQRRLADKAAFEAAVSMAQAGDLDDARSTFRQILAGNPADRAAAKALDRLSLRPQAGGQPGADDTADRV